MSALKKNQIEEVDPKNAKIGTDEAKDNQTENIAEPPNVVKYVLWFWKTIKRQPWILTIALGIVLCTLIVARL